MKIALYQPDIPQNVGAMMRLCACLDVHLDIIEPCGFPWDERKFKRSAMDYLTHVNVERYSSWQNFLEKNENQRIILMTTHAETAHVNFEFQDNDILLAGQESSGAPDNIHESVATRIGIPMENDLRSLNIVNATSMIVGEALRQTRWS